VIEAGPAGHPNEQDWSMTETQAKSGAVGASTDAPDTPDAATDSGGSEARAAASEESPTNVIRTGTSAAGAGSSDTSAGTATGATSSPASTPLRFAPAKPAPTSTTGSTTSPSGSAPKVAESEPTVRTSVPVVGVPASTPTSSPSTSPTITRPAALTTESTGRTSPAGVVTPSPTPVGRAPVVATSSLKTGVRPAPPGERPLVGAPARPPAVPVARDCT